jgi:hypothetical protein
VTWSAEVERRTAGYRILRRKVERCDSMLEEEVSESSPSGPPSEIFTGEWRKVTEVPAKSMGGEPRETNYRYLDEAPPGEWEYAVEELETSGLRGQRVRARQGRRAER